MIFSSLFLPVLLVYMLIILQALRYMLFRASRGDPHSSILARLLSAKDVALCAIALDVASITLIGVEAKRFDAPLTSSLFLPLILLVLHMQTLVFIDFLESRSVSEGDHRPTSSQYLLPLLFGLISLCTNAITVKGLLTTQPF